MKTMIAALAVFLIGLAVEAKAHDIAGSRGAPCHEATLESECSGYARRHCHDVESKAKDCAKFQAKQCRGTYAATRRAASRRNRTGIAYWEGRAVEEGCAPDPTPYTEALRHGSDALKEQGSTGIVACGRYWHGGPPCIGRRDGAVIITLDGED